MEWITGNYIISTNLNVAFLKNASGFNVTKEKIIFFDINVLYYMENT
jgi:hypothetical protein